MLWRSRPLKEKGIGHNITRLSKYLHIVQVATAWKEKNKQRKIYEEYEDTF